MDNPLNTQVGGNHYKDLAIQPAEFVMANKIPWAEGNAIKYIVRHRNKNGREDLEKAKHYIDMIIAREYPTEKFERQMDEKPTLDSDYYLGKWYKTALGDKVKVVSRKGDTYWCIAHITGTEVQVPGDFIKDCLQISAP